MRIVYAGTPPFAATILTALLASRHRVVLVLTQPDRPSGRGLKFLPSAVKTVAVAHGIAIAQPPTLRTSEAQQPIREAGADVIVVAAYGLILPQAVLDLAKYGAVNVHASLLPRWRGAAPIQRAILAGDRATGVTIMQMDAGLDTGYMLLSRLCSIHPNDTAGSVEEILAKLGAQALLEALDVIEVGEARAEPQPSEGVTYANKIQKGEARLDFNLPALQLDRAIRAFNPNPIAFTSFRGEPLRIWSGEPLAEAAGAAPAGTLELRLDGTVSVTCGQGSLLLREVQRPGGKPVSAPAWAAGVRLKPGERLGL